MLRSSYLSRQFFSSVRLCSSRALWNGAVNQMGANNFRKKQHLSPVNFSSSTANQMGTNNFLHGIETVENFLNPFIGSLTKLVVTTGPASDDKEIVQNMVAEGMQVLRINCSHATPEEISSRIKWIRSPNPNIPSDIKQAIMFDTKGPEIRTGKIDAELNGEVELVKGSKIVLMSDDGLPGNETIVKIQYPDIHKYLDPGHTVLLDDGAISLKVEGLNSDGNGLLCNVENTGIISERRGVNIPGVALEMEILTDKDKDDIDVAVRNDAEYIAASFVRNGMDVRIIRSFIGKCHDKYWPDNHPQPQIISKIECFDALINFESILEESDGIMVARGDLGVEIDFTTVSQAQKSIVRRCNEVGKPVIVATQMLESMIKNPRPTRAEVSDVVNAVYDGADAVMLSGESAKGDWPLESVITLRNIAKQADATFHRYRKKFVVSGKHNRDEVMARFAVTTAMEFSASLIVVMTSSGRSARLLAKFKGSTPIMAYCVNHKIGRQLVLCRGLTPIFHDDDSDDAIDSHQNDHSSPVDITDDNIKDMTIHSIRKAKELSFVKTGDMVVVVTAQRATSVLSPAMVVKVASVK